VVITPKFSTIFVCSHATANQKFRHFSTRRRAAKTAEHSLRVYYHPPESSPQLVTHSLLHKKLQYIFTAPSCDQSKHPSPSSPDRGSSFAPTESNIYDTLSTGIRPGYNNTSTNYNSLQFTHLSILHFFPFNPLNPELNPICYLLALLGDHHFLHVSRIRVKSLTFGLLMSYTYEAPILDVSRSHTTTQHSL